MNKREAISLIEEYLEQENTKQISRVPIHTNLIKRNISKYFNFLKYKWRLPFLRKVEISDWIKFDETVNDYMTIKKSSILESEYFWIIPCNSFKFFEDFDIRYGFIGLGPIVIHKKTKKLYRSYTSSLDILERIKKNEEINLEELNSRFSLLN